MRSVGILMNVIFNMLFDKIYEHVGNPPDSVKQYEFSWIEDPFKIYVRFIDINVMDYEIL